MCDGGRLTSTRWTALRRTFFETVKSKPCAHQASSISAPAATDLLRGSELNPCANTDIRAFQATLRMLGGF
jgi:hypothetical protein